MILNEYIEKFNKQKGKKELYEKMLLESTDKINNLEQKSKDIEIAQAFVQQVAKETQEKLKFHIEDIVQMALDACYFDEYEFIVDFEVKRGRTEANLYFEKDKKKVDPQDATGGGVVDITAFALRIAAWSLSKTDNVIIFDEPFKHLSNNLRNQAGEILNKLSKKLNIQKNLN